MQKSREITYHSWDAANKTIALVRCSIVRREIMQKEAADWLLVVNGMLDSLFALQTRESVDLIETICEIARNMRALREWVCGLITVRSAEVHDLLCGKLVKSVSGRDRALALKKFVGTLDDCPDVAIVEHQGSRIGGATPTFNLAVAHQLCYHYADTRADFVSINSSRKNKIALSAELTLSTIEARHSQKIGRAVERFTPDQKKTARKLHTAENMKWFCNLWRSSALSGVKPGLINHIADAFMQMLAYHFSTP